MLLPNKQTKKIQTTGKSFVSPHHLFKVSQTRRAAQPHGAFLQPEHDGHVTVHVATLADGHAVEAAETEEAGLAAELVHNTPLNDLVFALQSLGQQTEVHRVCKEKKIYIFSVDFSVLFPCAYNAVFAAHAASRHRSHWHRLLHLAGGFRWGRRWCDPVSRIWLLLPKNDCFLVGCVPAVFFNKCTAAR